MNLKIILYSILLIIGNLIVGIPGKENLVVVNCLYILIGIIYYLYKLIKYKNYKILTNKLDIFVFIFLMICPFLPLMFDTYASLEKSMLEVFRAISVFSMYIITRDLLKTNKKNIKIILNSFLISGVIFCILGFDIIGPNLVYPYLHKYLGFSQIKESSYIVSAFGYKNAFGIYIGIMLLISLYCSREYSKKYIILSIIFAICLFCSGSMIAIAMSFIIAYIYIISIIKNKKKSLIITFAIFFTMLIILILFITIIMQNKDTFSFDGASNERYALGNINANAKYRFKFDVENQSSNNYKIKIRQLNSNQIDEKYEEITIESGFKGTKSCNLITNSNIKYIFIQFSENKEATESLKVYNAKINDKEIVLKYKYLPSSLVRMGREYIFKGNSISERFMMIKAGIKLGLQEPIVGQGAHAWMYRSNEFQDWVSGARYMHSYPVDIFIQYGIIGVIVFAGIIVSCVLIFKKNNDRNLLFILVCLLLILLHSSLDFDMKYVTIFMDMFVLFAIVSSYQENNKKTKNEKTIVVLIVLAIYLFSSILSVLHVVYCITKNEAIENTLFYKNNRQLNLALDLIKIKEDDMALKLINAVSTKEKYKNLYIYYNSIDYANISEENLEFVYNYCLRHSLTIDYEYNLQRNEAICTIFSKLSDEYAKKFAQIIIDENDEMVQKINDYEQSSSSLSGVEDKLKVQEKHYNLALEKIQNER